MRGALLTVSARGAAERPIRSATGAATPYQVQIVPERRTIYVTARGKASFALAGEAIGDLVENPLFDPKFFLLVDLREIDYLPTNDEAQGFPRLMEVFRSRVALVATRGVNYGLARMVSAYSELADLEVQAFNDLESAELWLAEARSKPVA